MKEKERKRTGNFFKSFLPLFSPQCTEQVYVYTRVVLLFYISVFVDFSMPKGVEISLDVSEEGDNSSDTDSDDMNIEQSKET